MRPMGPGGPHFGPKMKQFVPRLPFDMVLCESAFPRVKAAPDESAFTQVTYKLDICNFIHSSSCSVKI